MVAIQQQRQAKLAAEKERQAQAREKANQTRIRKAAEKAASEAHVDASAEHAEGDTAMNGPGRGSAPTLNGFSHTNGFHISNADSNNIAGMGTQVDGENTRQQQSATHRQRHSPTSHNSDVDIMTSPERITKRRGRRHERTEGQIEDDVKLLEAEVDIMRVLPQGELRHHVKSASKAGNAGIAGPAGVADGEGGFDWAAWQDDIGSGIAERLGARERRAPKRPYSYEDDPKPPKLKKLGHRMHHLKSMSKHVR